jgi:hypothetical protein
LRLATRAGEAIEFLAGVRDAGPQARHLEAQYCGGRLTALVRVVRLRQGTEGGDGLAARIEAELGAGAAREALVVAFVPRDEFAEFLVLDRQFRGGVGPGLSGSANFGGPAEEGEGFGR